jgi:hypothetical protein
MMDKQILYTLIKLKNISKIQPGKRVDTSNGEIKMYKGGLLEFFNRWRYGDGRDKAVKSFIEIYKDTTSITNHIMDTKIFDGKMLSNIKDHMNESLNGLQNFENTYSKDSNVSSQITVIRDMIIYPQIEKIEKYLGEYEGETYDEYNNFQKKIKKENKNNN